MKKMRMPPYRVISVPPSRTRIIITSTISLQEEDRNRQQQQAPRVIIRNSNSNNHPTMMMKQYRRSMSRTMQIVHRIHVMVRVIPCAAFVPNVLLQQHDVTVCTHVTTTIHPCIRARAFVAVAAAAMAVMMHPSYHANHCNPYHRAFDHCHVKLNSWMMMKITISMMNNVSHHHHHGQPQQRRHRNSTNNSSNHVKQHQQQQQQTKRKRWMMNNPSLMIHVRLVHAVQHHVDHVNRL
mmetsp:Transcript_10338/g.29480  ORF Transcript_10338/g.29480 Transcript_10338/m.29480 type:complete len:237 (-) Transcript_10338:558-1268(-)